MYLLCVEDQPFKCTFICTSSSRNTHAHFSQISYYDDSNLNQISIPIHAYAQVKKDNLFGTRFVIRWKAIHAFCIAPSLRWSCAWKPLLHIVELAWAKQLVPCTPWTMYSRYYRRWGSPLGFHNVFPTKWKGMRLLKEFSRVWVLTRWPKTLGSTNETLKLASSSTITTFKGYRVEPLEHVFCVVCSASMHRYKIVANKRNW